MVETPIAPQEPLGLKIYRTVSRAAAPIASMALKRRLQAGKEDETRITERRGIPGRSRPEGELIWIHGASVGESLSVLPLVEKLVDLRPDASFLVTTGTVTSAALMSERLPPSAFHQFIPIDHPDFVESFLDHWRPDAAIFVESEFWPNLILTTRKKTPFMALINGRVSPKSYRDWSSQPNAIKFILSSFDFIAGQDQQNADRLHTLAGKPVSMFGNIKNAAPPLPADDAVVTALVNEIENRPRWLAASTHPGEEEIVIAAHKQLAQEFPNLLTIIAPRHPARGEEVTDLASAAGLKATKRTDNKTIGKDTEIYIADTLGELGLFYRLCDIAFVGGAITPKGGHNPLEPARLDAAILHGPETFNFVETYRDLKRAGGAALVRNDREMAAAVRRLFADPKTRAAMVKAAREAAEANAEKVLADITDALITKLPAPTEQK